MENKASYEVLYEKVKHLVHHHLIPPMPSRKLCNDEW
jgi:hypothetical protein